MNKLQHLQYLNLNRPSRYADNITAIQVKPSLDLNFARNKSLIDNVTGNNLVTFTRASSGTYMGSDGVLKTATTNLLGYSEDVSQWLTPGTGISIFTNQITSPGGTVTADQFIETATTGLHILDGTGYVFVTGETYTYSVFVKPINNRNFEIGYPPISFTSRFARFNLSGSGSVQGTDAGIFATIQAYPNGWYRCSATNICATGGGARIGNFINNSTFSRSYTGDTSAGIYIWGAQLEQSSTVGEYVPTTSTTNSAPRFDHAITSSVTNLVTNSATFQPTSVGSPASYTVDQVAPDGTTTASRQTATNPRTFVDYQGITNAQYTFSVYAKAASGTITISLQLKNAASDTIITTGSNVTLTTAWQRLTITGTTNGATTGARIEVVGPVIGAPAGTVFWGAQLEQSANVGTYVPTTTAAATSNTTESLGLLVEEQRTNSIRNNTMVGAVAGTPGTAPTNWNVSTVAGITRELVGVGTENGITYIDYRFSGTGTGNNDTQFDGPTASQNQIWTASVYLKIVGGSTNNVTIRQVMGEFNSGSFLGATVTDVAVGTGPLATQRFSHTRTLSNATVNSISTTVRVATTGTIDITLRIGLPQLEQGSFATSVIPTSTATATRSADVASITGTNFSSWYRQDEGTVFAESRVQEFTVTNFSRIASLDRGDATTNFAAIVRSSALNRVEYSVFAGTGQAVGLQPAITFAAGSTLRSAFVYKTDDFIAAANGTLSPADTLGTVTTAVTTLGVGMQGNGGLPYNGTIRRITYFPQRISNAKLQKITQ